MRFKILGSSSSGNASLLCTQEAKVLIDAGFSGKKILQMLDKEGLTIQDIDAVFFTHEHADHCAGLQGLSKHSHLQFFANESTRDSVIHKLRRPVNWSIFETDSTFKFKDLSVHGFSIPHDASDPVGYLFKTPHQEKEGEDHSLAWITDLGHAPQVVKDIIREVDILVLESNYDPDLLDMDTIRPWSVKQRIRGRHGHLSNDDALSLMLDVLEGATEPKLKHLFLAHLSQHCNTPQIVEKIFEPIKRKDPTFSINIVDPIGYTAPITELI